MARRAAHATVSVAQWPLLVVAGGVAIGLVLTLVSDTSWRLGCLVIGGSVTLGALIRLVLGDRHAGLLAVRDKRQDVVVLTLLGVAIVVLAVMVPAGR